MRADVRGQPIRKLGDWVEVYEDDVDKWRTLCSSEEWERWQIEGADRCHDPVDRSVRTGPDTTAGCLAALEKARRRLSGLPSNRKQNYEAHRAIGAAVDLVRGIAGGVCSAAEGMLER